MNDADMKKMTVYTTNLGVFVWSHFIKTRVVHSSKAATLNEDD